MISPVSSLWRGEVLKGSSSQNEGVEAFSSLRLVLISMILSKILGLLISRMLGRAYIQRESVDY